MQIYLVHECGDDYHGSRIASAFTDKTVAKNKCKELDANQEPCGDCGFTYYYTIEEIKVTE